MDDLISRKGAINVIEDTEDCVCSYVAIALGDAINKIAKLPPSSRWVSCSEQLPKNDDWKIVTILDESGDTPSRYTDFGWYLEAANCWIVEAEQRTDVIAWMPLPKPYKEVTE